jgi:hypothetical protein
MRLEPLLESFKRCSAALAKRGALSAVVLLGALFSANCGEQPTSPSEFGGLSSDPNVAAMKPHVSAGPEWTVVQPMTVSGGYMALDGTDVLCSFPQGALPVDATTITARMKLNAQRGSATRIEFDFQPSMEFVKPVKLVIASNYLAGTNNKYTLWFFDPEKNRWEREDEEAIVLGRPVVFDIFHYSGYAVSR